MNQSLILEQLNKQRIFSRFSIHILVDELVGPTVKLFKKILKVHIYLRVLNMFLMRKSVVTPIYHLNWYNGPEIDAEIDK